MQSDADYSNKYFHSVPKSLKEKSMLVFPFICVSFQLEADDKHIEYLDTSMIMS